MDVWQVDNVNVSLFQVGKLFTPNVPTAPSGAEGRLNQLTSGIADTSVATSGGQVVNLPASNQIWCLVDKSSTGRGKGTKLLGRVAGITLCDPIWHAGSRNSAATSSTNCIPD